MKDSMSVRGFTPASAYARDAASNMSSFQLYSGVDGRKAVIPTPTIPTRMILPRGCSARSRESRVCTKDCRTGRGRSSGTRDPAMDDEALEELDAHGRVH